MCRFLAIDIRILCSDLSHDFSCEQLSALRLLNLTHILQKTRSVEFYNKNKEQLRYIKIQTWLRGLGE